MTDPAVAPPSRISGTVSFDSIRTIAAVAVVVLHVSAESVLTAAVGSRDWWAGNVFDSFMRWSVPVFVMLSGALLLQKDEGVIQFLRKRAARLLVPLVFWSTLYLAIFHQGGLTAAGRKVISGSVHFHLWYLYMIFGLYLVTPYLRTLVQNTSRLSLTALAAGLFALWSVNHIHGAVSGTPVAPPVFLNVSLQYIPYFLAGHLIASATSRPPRAMLVAVFGATGFLIAAGTFVLSDRWGVQRGLFLYNYLSPPVILMSLAGMMLIRPTVGRGRTALGKLSFGVYLVHPLILAGLAAVGLGPTTFNSWAAIPLVSGLTTIASFAVAAVISRMRGLRHVI